MSAIRASLCLTGFLLLAGVAQSSPGAIFPPPIPSPDYGDFTLTATPARVPLEGTVTASWTAAPPRQGDWVALYEAGASQYLAFCYTGATASGSCSFRVWNTGTFEFRYHLIDTGYPLVAVSPRFEVYDPCVGAVHSLSVDGPAAGPAYRPLTVRWNVDSPECFRGNDWIGVYATGSPNTSYLGYFYPPAASGSQVVHAPGALGSYEFRYLPGGAYVDVKRSNAFAVADCAAGDRDCDGRPDASDPCPYFGESTPLADADGDGRGDECECGDQDGDGRNTVADLVAINQAVFDPARATPLCDTNNDARCDVQDIVGAQIEIFSPGQTATCNRQPVP
jgi:hypothetical protein